MNSFKLFDNRNQDIWPRRITLAMIVLFAIHLAIGVNTQFIDGDEGGYLTLSKLIAEGATPHLDLFAPQVPLFFYLYGFWMKLFGYSLEIGRILSALMTLTSVYFFSLTISLLTNKRAPWTVLVATALLSMNSAYFVQNVQLKHYAPSLSFMVIAFYFFAQWKSQWDQGQKNHLWSLFSAWFCFAVSFNSRSFVVLAIPVTLVFVLIPLIRSKNIKTILKSLFVSFLGGLIPSAPSFWIAFQDWQAFRFNVDYAILKYYAPAYLMTNSYKVYVFKATHIDDPQFFLLALIALLGLFLALINWIKNGFLKTSVKYLLSYSLSKWMTWFYLLCGAAIAGVYLFHSPAFYRIQWTSVTPFYVFAAVMSFHLTCSFRGRFLWISRLAFGVPILVYLGIFLFKGVFTELKYNLPHYGHHDVPLREQSPWTYLIYNHRDYQNGGTYRSLSTVRKVADYLQLHTPKNSIILSWLNSPLAMTDRQPVKNYEQGASLSEILWRTGGPSEADGKRFHALSELQVKGLIANQEPDYVIIDPYTEKEIASLVPEHYELETQITQYFIYRRKAEIK